MKDKKLVKLSELKWQKDKLNEDSNWVIMAVIVQKLPPKQASNVRYYFLKCLSYTILTVYTLTQLMQYKMILYASETNYYHNY